MSALLGIHRRTWPDAQPARPGKRAPAVDLAGLLRLHVPAMLATIVLTCLGIAFIRSAGLAGSESAAGMWKKQILWASTGFLLYLGVAATDYGRLYRRAWLWYGIGIALLVVVLVAGRKVYGARRWILIPPGFTLQPAEFAKLATLLLMTRLLTLPNPVQGQKGALLLLLAVMLVPMVLVFKEPDLGSSLIFAPMCMAMMFVGGVSMRLILGVALLGSVAVAAVLAAIFVPERVGVDAARQKRIQSLVHISDYQRQRIEVFLNPEADLLGAGWNKRQSELAVGSGSVFGKGYGKGTQNTLGFLPRTVSPTDFIFSVVAEESGFAGSALVVGLFAFLVVFGMRAAVLARDKAGRLLCVGVVSMVFCHVFVNIGMTVGVVPVTGLPLPFISYGGSFMVTMMFALGIVQSVYVRHQARA